MMKKLCVFMALVMALLPALCAFAPAFAEVTDVATPQEGEQTQTAPVKGTATLGSMGSVAIERKKTVTVAVPVAFSAGDEDWYTNMLASGSIVAYDPTRSAVGYSDDIFNALESLTVEIVQEGSVPFYPETIPSRRCIVGTLNSSTAKDIGFEDVGGGYRDPLNGNVYPEGTRFNSGFAVFEGLVVHSDVRNGEYDIPVKIRWESEKYGSGSTTVVVKATAENSDVPEKTTGGGGGGGGYYYGGGGGGGNTQNTPEAKLIVQGVSTVPENPVAGEEFDLILKLYNTSAEAAVSNITVICEADGDAVLPVSGAFGAYIDTIGANRALEQRFRVRAQSDIDDAPVKIYVMIDYEDPDATAHSASQTVVINVDQLMRIRLDEPVLPTDVSVAGESYPVSMGVFNLGRTTLYNVTVSAQSDNPDLSVGASFYCGNMESGTGKTAELRLTPTAAGSFGADIVVTYENGRGESFTEKKSIAFYSENYEEDDWLTEMEPVEPVETPEPGPARQALEVAAILPWWVYAFVGGVFMLLVVSIGVSARHRRIRAFEDDEME